MYPSIFRMPAVLPAMLLSELLSKTLSCDHAGSDMSAVMRTAAAAVRSSAFRRSVIEGALPGQTSETSKNRDSLFAVEAPALQAVNDTICGEREFGVNTARMLFLTTCHVKVGAFWTPRRAALGSK